MGRLVIVAWYIDLGKAGERKRATRVGIEGKKGLGDDVRS